MIEAVRERRVSLALVLAAVAPRTRRADELHALLDVCAGSQSEAEIAILLRVVRAHGLPEPDRQFAVTAAGNSYRLDLAYPACRLAIEVDGKAWHFNADRRSADIRRDAQLAATGWLTLRFTYEQITDEAAWVAACIVAAVDERSKIA